MYSKKFKNLEKKINLQETFLSTLKEKMITKLVLIFVCGSYHTHT